MGRLESGCTLKAYREFESLPLRHMTADRVAKIAALRAVPNDLQAALNGLTEAQLRFSYREGGWNVRQIVHHIADSHLHAYVRMKWLLAEDNPSIKVWNQDDWALARDYEQDIQPSVHIITGIQERMANIFETATEADWKRTAQHPERGSITLDDFLNMYHSHGAHHIAQILAVKNSSK